MKLAVEWDNPIPLQQDPSKPVSYFLDWEHLPSSPGVYIFARKYSESFEALYVGKTKNLRTRAKSHLNNLRLMNHLASAKSGRRIFIAGYPVTKSGQPIEKVITLLERTLIRHFLAEGHDLVNTQGTRIRRHEIESIGSLPKTFIPSQMYLEKPRGKRGA